MNSSRKGDRIGTCDSCGKDKARIVAGWSTRASKRCARCEVSRRMAAAGKQPAMKKTARLGMLRQMDDEMNTAIWATRPHVCVECGKRLLNPPPKHYFSHVLSKGAHPELRHDPENVVLHCIVCHRDWETSGKRRRMTTYTMKISYMVSKGFVEQQ